MDKAELVAYVSGKTRFAPQWISVHYNVFGEVLADILDSDDYSEAVAHMAEDNSPPTVQVAAGPAIILLWRQPWKDRTKDLSFGQFLRLNEILSEMIVTDAREGQQRRKAILGLIV